MGDREGPAPAAGLPPVYDASAVEGRIYADWLARGLFTPRPDGPGRPYVIVIPPPNVTAVLHMGHGLNTTVQDVLVRFERMRGRKALWVPGTDHAGIATQNVVERLLSQEGRTRFDLGREAFVERVWAYVRETGGTILEQLKAIGCSCDWTRTRFTLEPQLSRAVREVFVRLWEKDLVYRGHRVIHWCPRCHTALSDEEAEHGETDGRLYHIRYPLADGSGHVTVATTRPETMLGDVAVSVSPDDEAKRHLVGRAVRLPIAEVEIPIIADEHVDRAFGTGFVKITPAHDADDFEVGLRHALPMPLIMTDEGRMADLALEGRAGGRVPEPIFGLDRFEARRRVLEIIESRGLLAKSEPHRHAVRHCYRCDTVVEPRLSDQWFVRMKPLAEPALEAYRKGEVRFIPERRGDEYEQWMTGIRDWNISRQLWWGHRIPVFYCDGCGSQRAYRDDPACCPQCGGPLRQDEDVLDTWFSSWLWPFSTLGWPDDTEDLRRFYPTDVLVTAPEILFFWVARMIMAGFFCVGRSPFHTVYLHGTVRDTRHRKMSKSLGNGIDPLDVVRLYGADALRFEVTHGLAVGTDIILDPNDLGASFASGRNFANKLWNIGRLLVPYLEGRAVRPLGEVPETALGVADRWVLSRLAAAAGEATRHLEKFRLNDAVGAPYHFLWDEFADWWLEQAKPRLGAEGPDGEVARSVAAHCFDAALRLLHPVLPFITEELWGRLPGNLGRTIVTAEWPGGRAGREDPEAESDFGLVQAIVNQVRAIRADYGVRPNQPVDASLSGLSESRRGVVEAERATMLRLARLSSLTTEPASGPGAHALLPGGADLFVSLGGAIDVAKERGRLAEERDRLGRQLEGLRAKLANPAFTSRAPAEVVERERAKEEDWTRKRDALSAKLAALGAE
jgi:valyl-tRNA synthetase